MTPSRLVSIGSFPSHRYAYFGSRVSSRILWFGMRKIAVGATPFNISLNLTGLHKQVPGYPAQFLNTVLLQRVGIFLVEAGIGMLGSTLQTPRNHPASI